MKEKGRIISNGNLLLVLMFIIVIADDKFSYFSSTVHLGRRNHFNLITSIAASVKILGVATLIISHVGQILRILSFNSTPENHDSY